MVKELNGAEGVDYVVCAICGGRFNFLVIHLVRTHKINKEQYLELYPNSLLISEIGLQIQKDGLEKGKKTNLDRFGVENAFQSEMIKDKIKKDNLEKYGVEYNVQRPEVAAKISVSLTGHEVSQERRDKQAVSMTGKLVGDKNPSKRPEVAAKISSSLIGHEVTEVTRQKIRENMPDGSMENNNNWQGGLSFDPYPKEFFDQRNYIKDKYNNCDYFTGIHKDICSTQELSIHHIDYDKQNNNESNLVPLNRYNHGLTNGKRPFWHKLIKYAQNYDTDYYKEEDINFNIWEVKYKK